MKKLNQKGFSHHLMIVGIVALVVAAAGFAGWRVYQGAQINASAKSRNYTVQKSSGQAVTYYSCKIKVLGVWYVAAKYTNDRTTTITSMTYDVYKKGQLNKGVSRMNLGSAAAKKSSTEVVGRYSYEPTNSMDNMNTC